MHHAAIAILSVDQAAITFMQQHIISCILIQIEYKVGQQQNQLNEGWTILPVLCR